jgi:hypothetical protein
MDYVILNSSPNTVVVTYTIREIPGDSLAATGMGVPAMLSATEISEGEWRPLPATEFTFDRPNRTVVVSLPPNQGLLIQRGAEWRSDSSHANSFLIREIRIAGITGEMILRGDQVHKSFEVGRRPFFGPPTQSMMTYK